MSAYVPQNEVEELPTDEVVPPAEQTMGIRASMRNRVLKKTGQTVEPPRDDAVFYPGDDDYGVFAKVT